MGILGNHDYGLGWSHPEIAARLADQLRSTGVHIPRNEVTEVSGLQVVGLDDLWANQFDLRRGLAPLDSSRPATVLSHNPDTDLETEVVAGTEEATESCEKPTRKRHHGTGFIT